MHRVKTSYKHRPLSFLKMFLPGFIVFSLLISANLAIAGSSSHNGGQWSSVGGKIVASGEGYFSNKWLRATRYAHGDGKYWKNDEPTSNKSTGKKIPATHTLEEVNKDIWSRKGQITVLGPGYLGLFVRSRGAGAVLKFPKSGKVFYTQGLGKDEWLHDAQDNWKWYPGEVVNVDPTNSNAMSGWVPAGRTLTLDVWTYNPFSDWGIWGSGYGAPKSVEYEFWFFPRKGGKVIKVAEAPSKSVVDDVNNLPPGAMGYVKSIKGSKNGKLINGATGKAFKEGDIFYEGDILETHDVKVTMSFLPPDGPICVIDRNAKIIIKGKATSTKKGGVFNAFGRIFLKFMGQFSSHKKFMVEHNNSVAGVEGTEFETSYNPSTGETSVSVFEGIVRLDCTKGKADPIIVNAGMQATMDGNCNHSLSKIDPDKNTPAKAGWDVDTEPNDIDDKPDGEIARLAPIADSNVYAYSYRNWNQANWGRYRNLGAGWHPSGGEKRIYLKFDLAGIDPKSAGKATLKLFHYHTGGKNSLSLEVHAVTSPWQEGGGTYHPGQNEKTAAPGEISWAKQPSFDSSAVASFKPGPKPGKYIEADITPLVKAWLSGKPNYGLVIKPAGKLSGRTPESSYGFHSREHDDEGKRPVLILSGSTSSNAQPGTQPAQTGSNITGGGSTQGTARLLTAKSKRDMVGRNETLKGNGRFDAVFRAQFSAPNRTVTAVEVSNTNGLRSVWDTRPNNRLWLGGVVIGGRTMNRPDGSVNFKLGSGQNILDFFVEDNGSIIRGKTNYHMTIFFTSGDPLIMDITTGE